MGKAEKEKINEKHTGTDFTCITFCPDLPKFKMERLDNDFVALLKRRAYDMAGVCRGVSVYLNGEKLKVQLRKYLTLNFAKFLRTRFLTEHHQWLFLKLNRFLNALKVNLFHKSILLCLKLHLWKVQLNRGFQRFDDCLVAKKPNFFQELLFHVKQLGKIQAVLFCHISYT